MTNDKEYQIARDYVQYMLDSLKSTDGEEIEYFLESAENGSGYSVDFLDHVADFVQVIVEDLEKELT